MDKKIDRRAFLVGAGAAAAMVPGAATAEMACSAPTPYNGAMVRSCSVGVRVTAQTRQRCDQWCWAACVEAAFGLAGFRLSQERIVERLYGSSFVCAPAAGPGIAAAINQNWVDDRGRRFRGQVQVINDVQFGVQNPYALQIAADYLRRGVPLINGALGHATLMTAITWLEDSYGNLALQEIILRDPWPGRQNRRRMTPQEFYGATFLAAVWAG